MPRDCSALPFGRWSVGRTGREGWTGCPHCRRGHVYQSGPASLSSGTRVRRQGHLCPPGISSLFRQPGPREPRPRGGSAPCWPMRRRAPEEGPRSGRAGRGAACGEGRERGGCTSAKAGGQVPPVNSACFLVSSRGTDTGRAGQDQQRQGRVFRGHCRVRPALVKVPPASPGRAFMSESPEQPPGHRAWPGTESRGPA